MEGLNIEFVKRKEYESMKKYVNMYELGIKNEDKRMEIGN